MHREKNCCCGEHGTHHGEQNEARPEGHGGDCGCGGHTHHGVGREGHHDGGCGCGCHQPHGGMKFHRHFISREDMVTRLEEYLKQLQAEAKGVEERIAEMKKEEE
jgi:hypothetical protein